MIVNFLAIIGLIAVLLMVLVAFGAFIATLHDRRRAEDSEEYRGWMDEEKKWKE